MDASFSSQRRASLLTIADYRERARRAETRAVTYITGYLFWKTAGAKTAEV